MQRYAKILAPWPAGVGVFARQRITLALSLNQAPIALCKATVVYLKRIWIVRTIPLYLALIGSIIVSYVAGVVSYPLVAAQWGMLLPSPKLEIPGDPVDMTLYWQVWQHLQEDFYGEKPSAENQRYGAIRGLTTAFGDLYTRFEDPPQTTVSREYFCGCYWGIGASIEARAEGFVLLPVPDQPAAQAGIQTGDILVQVDETLLTAELTIDEVVQKVRGNSESEVKLVVHRPGADPTLIETFSFRIARMKFQIPSMEWRLLDSDPATQTIGYIHHMSFSENSATEMKQAISELQAKGAQSYILDLSGNAGGSVDIALQIIDMWLNEGVMLIEEHANGQEDVFTATAGGEAVTAPLVVVVDGGSASASEIVAGALQDHGRAQLVGKQTYGKGSVQLRYEFEDKSSLFVTNAQWFTPARHQISGAGLTPNVVVEEGGDPLLAAITSLQQANALPETQVGISEVAPQPTPPPQLYPHRKL